MAIGKLTYVGKFNTFTFNISKGNNPDNFEKIKQYVSKLHAEHPELYVPMMLKEFSGFEYIQVQAVLPQRLRVKGVKPVVGEKYDLNWKCQSSKDRIKNIITRIGLIEETEDLREDEEYKEELF